VERIVAARLLALANHTDLARATARGGDGGTGIRSRRFNELQRSVLQHNHRDALLLRRLDIEPGT
jgi:hypothetical protein